MSDYKRLRTGDPCPCCGQPIKTDDPDILELLSRIAADPLYRITVSRLLDDLDMEESPIK